MISGSVFALLATTTKGARMELSTALLTIAIVSALWGVVDAILIAVALDKRSSSRPCLRRFGFKKKDTSPIKRH